MAEDFTAEEGLHHKCNKLDGVTPETTSEPTTPLLPQSGSRECLPPFEGFIVDKILSNNLRTKTVSISGRFASHSDECAVIIAEKQPLTETDFNDLFSSQTSLTRSFQNDIYSQYQASCTASIGPLKLMSVYPATDAHIRKYSDQPLHVVHETPEDYETLTKPFIEKQAFSLEWVYNILDGKAEADRLIYNDPDPQNGFIIAPDMKWDQKDLQDLYVLAIVRRRGVYSMRELRGEHLPLLKNVLHRGRRAIREKYGLTDDQIRAYLHYQPSYYHLHVHFTHIKYDAPKTSIGEAHLLEEVIDNIEIIDPFYYQKKTISFVVKEFSPLWQELKKRKCV